MIRRLFSLSWIERALGLRALAGIVRTDLDLRLRGFSGALGQCREAWIPVHMVSEADLLHARHYAHWIAAAARRYPSHAECLHRALTLHRWLRGEGLPSEFRIGVRLEGRDLRAHAWVELLGRTVDDSEASVGAFVPLAETGKRVEAYAWS